MPSRRGSLPAHPGRVLRPDEGDDALVAWPAALGSQSFSFSFTGTNPKIVTRSSYRGASSLRALRHFSQSAPCFLRANTESVRTGPCSGCGQARRGAPIRHSCASGNPVVGGPCAMAVSFVPLDSPGAGMNTRFAGSKCLPELGEGARTAPLAWRPRRRRPGRGAPGRVERPSSDATSQGSVCRTDP